jgi:glutamine amidotransferase
MLFIVDYGVGNLASIKNMLKKIGVDAEISGNEDDINTADRLILPGVGAFDTCVMKLQQSGLQEVLNKKVLRDKTPVLGICVGMQLLLSGSEEGILPGLGWVAGKNVKFSQEKMPPGTKIPHMGWTDVVPAKSSKLLQPLYDDPRYYFVHSYHAQLEKETDALLYADYGYRFVAAVEKDNILGVQFHPEKSHKFGMQLLENFVKNY